MRPTSQPRSPSGLPESEWESLDDVISEYKNYKLRKYLKQRKCQEVIFFFLDSSTKLEDVRKRREEKKLQRQKELETRRATRNAGPMKLGAKKI